MNKLSHEQRCAVLRCLVDGNSIAATTRITKVAKNTIQNLTIAVGEACLNYSDEAIRGVKSKRVQVDEIWNFCYAKDKNLPEAMRGQPGVGSMWTWVALDADSKLIISWELGARDAVFAHFFIKDLSQRLGNRMQLTSDGAKVYLEAVADNFVRDVDFAQLIKVYGNSPADESRYSPAKCLGTKNKIVVGSPDPEHISTSYAERQNLNLRMQNRRYTRLTNAFSKKAEMLAYSIAISFTYHNFVRVHQTLGTTPAIAAGLTKRKWAIESLVDLADEWEAMQRDDRESA